jgi:hypothetical protein
VVIDSFGGAPSSSEGVEYSILRWRQVGNIECCNLPLLHWCDCWCVPTWGGANANEDEDAIIQIKNAVHTRGNIFVHCCVIKVLGMFGLLKRHVIDVASSKCVGWCRKWNGSKEKQTDAFLFARLSHFFGEIAANKTSVRQANNDRDSWSTIQRPSDHEQRRAAWPRSTGARWAPSKASYSTTKRQNEGQ